MNNPLARTRLWRQRSKVGLFIVSTTLSAVACAFDTAPAAKITEMDIYGATQPTGTVVYVRLDPAVAISITGFSTCTAPNNFFALTTNSDADRAVLAQLQTAYALRKPVVLHVTGCGTVGGITYPVAVGVWTF